MAGPGLFPAFRAKAPFVREVEPMNKPAAQTLDLLLEELISLEDELGIGKTRPTVIPVLEIREDIVDEIVCLSGEELEEAPPDTRRMPCLAPEEMLLTEPDKN